MSLFLKSISPIFLPQATGAEIIKVSRYGIVGFGLFMGVLAILLNVIGLNLGWVYLFMVRKKSVPWHYLHLPGMSAY
jgi:hypothetical protein